VPGLWWAGPRGRIDQMGEVSRLILLGIAETERTEVDPLGGSVSTGSACQEAIVGSNVPLGINSVPASGGAGLEG
jgi:hypothetical protein